MGDKLRIPFYCLVTMHLLRGNRTTPNFKARNDNFQETEVDGHVDLSITDNGIGMAEDILNRVFELFAQATRSSDRSQGGLGLGLALAKRLVELHEGVITAHSKGLGKGSTLRVKLPRVDSISHQDSIDGAINRKIGHSEEFNIIVVDDNVDAADMLSMMLGLIGYQVSTESSSIKTLDNHRPEQDTVYILDIGLPDMDGRELAKRLRGISTDAFIIALTGYGHKENDDLLPDGPFNHYLVKPVDVKQLEEILLNVSFNR